MPCTGISYKGTDPVANCQWKFLDPVETPRFSGNCISFSRDYHPTGMDSVKKSPVASVAITAARVALSSAQQPSHCNKPIVPGNSRRSIVMFSILWLTVLSAKSISQTRTDSKLFRAQKILTSSTFALRSMYRHLRPPCHQDRELLGEKQDAAG